jgi:hypothetical protein
MVQPYLQGIAFLGTKHLGPAATGYIGHITGTLGLLYTDLHTYARLHIDTACLDWRRGGRM